jgi:hypothetical protein
MTPLYILLIIIIAILLLLFLPIKGKKHKLALPERHLDERDTMFSRNEIISGEKRFDEYYKMHPESRQKDNDFRSKPGLLSYDTTYYNRYAFASANASFEAVKAFFPLRMKAGGMEQGAGEGGKPSQIHDQVRDDRLGRQNTSEKLSGFMKQWAKKMGAHSAGITEMKDYHFYTCGGRQDSHNC